MKRFASLISALTLPYRYTPVAKKEFAIAVPNLSWSQSNPADYGEKIDILGNKYKSTYDGAKGEYHYDVEPSKGFYNLIKSKVFETATQFLTQLDEEEKEKIADVLASQFSIAFEKNDTPHFAFPLSSCGWKIGKTKHPSGQGQIKTLAHWRSSFSDRLSRYEKARMAGRELPEPAGTELDAPEIRDFSTQQQASIFGGSISGMEGVDLLLDVKSSASSEEELPFLEVSKKNWSNIGLANLVLSIYMGDKFDWLSGKQSLSTHPLANFTIEYRFRYDSKEKRASPDVASAPFSFLSATALNVLENLNLSAIDDSEKKNEKRKGIKEKYKLLVPLVDFHEELENSTKDLLERARLKAEARAFAWLETHGLKEAWAAAANASGREVPSAKDLTWMLANPLAAKAMASPDPLDRFCSTMSRPFGIMATERDVLHERVVSRLKEIGMSEETFHEMLANKTATDFFSKCASVFVQSKNKERASHEKFMTFVAYAFDQSKKIGLSLEETVEICSIIERDLLSFFETQARMEPLSIEVPTRSLSNQEKAKEFVETAEAKKDAYPWFVGMLIKQLKADLDEAKTAPKEEYYRSNTSYVFNRTLTAALECNGKPFFEWREWDEKMSFRDFQMRRTAKLAAAIREASASGPVGIVAAAGAEAFALLDASSGNDLIAKTREKLKTELGLSESGWKSLAKSSAASNRMITLLDSLSETALNQRKTFQEGQQNVKASLRSFAGFYARMLSIQNQFSLSSEIANAIIKKDAESGHIGMMAELMSPDAAAQSHSTEEGGRFYIEEGLAKERKISFVVKACFERIAQIAKKEGLDAEAATLKWYSDELPLVTDWLRRSEEGLWQQIPEKPSWGVLWRMQKDWHDEVLATANDPANIKKKGGKSWTTLIGMTSDGPWSAIEMSNGGDLAEEGREMRHCVSSYSSNCRSGTSRIFSIRFAGERVCTLEIAPFDEHNKRISLSSAKKGSVWKIVQNKGKCNANVENKEALAFCEKLPSLYSNALDKKIESDKEKAREAAKIIKEKARIKMLEDVAPVQLEEISLKDVSDEKQVNEGRPKKGRIAK